MGANSAIEWTNATWNPWQGCTKISPACEHCYMFTDLKRYGRDGSIVVRSKPPTFNLPLKRKRGGEYAVPAGSKVFTCSWSDWFHKSADRWRPEAWDIIRRRPDVTFQIVTKRTDRIGDCLPSDWGDGWSNVWLIATVENQHLADVRIAQLAKVPSAVHGLSCEPLLGPIDLTRTRNSGPETYNALTAEVTILRRYETKHTFLTSDSSPINWVIVGGESGPGARPTNPEWARAIREQCRTAGVPFFFKQWGDWEPGYSSGGFPIIGAYSGRRIDVPEDLLLGQTSGKVHCWEATDREGSFMGSVRVGKKVAGRLLDHREWNQFPQTERAMA